MFRPHASFRSVTTFPVIGDRRLAKNQNGKRKVVVVVREKGGQTVTKVFNSEAAVVAAIAAVIELGSTVHADEAPHWDILHDRFLTKRINHEWAYSDEGACTNDADSFFSRVRRAEIGIHHHIAGPYFAALCRRDGLAGGQPAGFERASIARLPERKFRGPIRAHVHARGSARSS